MCDPVSLAITAAVITAGGQIYGGMAANAQGKYEQAVDQRNAKLAEQSGVDAQQRGEREQMRLWRQTAQRMGEQRAQFAASGLDVNFGTPDAVLGDTLAIGSEDVQTSADNTNKERRGFDIQAANYVAAGTAARAKGHAALVGGYIGAAGSLLGAASQGMKSSASSRTASFGPGT